MSDYNDDIQKELHEMDSMLAGMKKIENFKVPDNYFDQMQNNVLASIKNEESKQAIPTDIEQPVRPSIWDQIAIFIQSLVQPQMALRLASVALLIGAAFFLLKPQEATPTLAINETLSESDAEYFIAENLDDIDDELFLELEMSDAIDFFDNDVNNEIIDEIINEYLDDLDDDSIENLL